MTQDEKWIARYNEVMTFIETNKRNPSKHRIEEHDYLNWLKADGRCLMEVRGQRMLEERIEDLIGQLKKGGEK